MTDRLALKRLTASDLTFFETLFRSLNVGNQKSINLNADVFIERFYPTLAQLGSLFPVRLVIYGPNSAAADTLSRAITKQDAYKNWRLNGEFVRDPEDQPGRYGTLSPGDLAILDFSGDPTPQKTSLLLISSAQPLDGVLYKALSPLIPGGRKTMVELSRAALADAAAGVPNSHPVWVLAADPEFDAAMEDAALGGLKGTVALAKTGKTISAEALAAKRLSAEKNGRDGEALAWIRLQELKASGALKEVEWSSQTNAISAYDFAVTDKSDAARRIDAKSTSGKFENPIHISIPELTAAASAPPYDLWRVYNINSDGASLKITSDIASAAKKVLAALSLPPGVTVDGVSIDPKILTWGPEISIKRPEEEG